MSLKFGIYLVEQRIISPEQFCGIVKIKGESMATLATIALRKNLMTIKQVKTVIDIAELDSNASFVRLALDKGMIDQQDASTLLAAQEESTPSIRSLLVECGLLTKHQCAVLFAHYQKQGLLQSKPTTNTVKQPHTKRPSRETPAPSAKPAGTATATKPPQPKFQQHRPMIVRQHST